MNVKNNKRRRDSIEKIEKVFINLIQTKELHEISVSDICKLADLNRSTFYANFLDIYDLADKIKEHLEDDFNKLFDQKSEANSGALEAVKMFEHIRENQLFYKTYFKLDYGNEHHILRYDTVLAEKYFSNKHMQYHIEFFKSGLNAIIKMWLDGGCKETPEEMSDIITSEYQGRT